MRAMNAPAPFKKVPFNIWDDERNKHNQRTQKMSSEAKEAFDKAISDLAKRSTISDSQHAELFNKFYFPRSKKSIADYIDTFLGLLWQYDREKIFELKEYVLKTFKITDRFFYEHNKQGYHVFLGGYFEQQLTALKAEEVRKTEREAMVRAKFLELAKRNAPPVESHNSKSTKLFFGIFATFVIGGLGCNLISSYLSAHTWEFIVGGIGLGTLISYLWAFKIHYKFFRVPEPMHPHEQLTETTVPGITVDHSQA